MAIDRYLAQSLLSALTAKYDTVQRVLKESVASGFKYAADKMHIDAGRYMQMKERFPKVVALKSHAEVPQRLMVHTPFNNDRLYRVFGEATYYNSATGEYAKRKASFYTDLQGDKWLTEEQFLNEYETQRKGYEWQAVGFERFGVWHNRYKRHAYFSNVGEI